jgi:hypothetical protein
MKVNPDLFIDIYDFYQWRKPSGFKVLYPQDNQEIKDIIGTYVV